MATVTLMGKNVNTNAELPTLGEKAPDFSLVNAHLKNTELSKFSGKKLLIYTVPSLDTGVCLKSTVKFNQDASNIENANIIIVSADLPFAMSRIAKLENLKKIQLLSMMRDKSFAQDYGVLITDGMMEGLTTRAIIVIDEDAKVTYTELVKDIGSEPNYLAALRALA